MIANAKIGRGAGLAMSGLVIAFMLLDAGMKLVPLEVVVRSTAELGYPPSPALMRGLGLLGLACTLLYAVPRTTGLGAILLTAYMGGAVATHVRVGSPAVQPHPVRRLSRVAGLGRAVPAQSRNPRTAAAAIARGLERAGRPRIDQLAAASRSSGEPSSLRYIWSTCSGDSALA